MTKSLHSVVAIGAASVDRVFIAQHPLLAATSNPARLEYGFGGVARNVAENLARLGAAAALCSRVGDDEEGHALVRTLAQAGCDVSEVSVQPGENTAQYAALVERTGELYCAASDMHVLDSLTVTDLDRWLAAHPRAEWIFIDCNVPLAVLDACVRRAASAPWKLAVGGTSSAKVLSLPADLSAVELLFLNEREDDAAEHPNARNVVVTRGARGVLLRTGAALVEMPAIVAAPVNVTGAGDALAAGTIFGRLLGKPLEEAVSIGLRLAHDAVESLASVPSATAGGR